MIKAPKPLILGYGWQKVKVPPESRTSPKLNLLISIQQTDRLRPVSNTFKKASILVIYCYLKNCQLKNNTFSVYVISADELLHETADLGEIASPTLRSSRGRMSSCLYAAWTQVIKSATSWQKSTAWIAFDKLLCPCLLHSHKNSSHLFFNVASLHFQHLREKYWRLLCRRWPLTFPSVDSNLGVLGFSGYCARSLWLRVDVVSISL